MLASVTVCDAWQQSIEALLPSVTETNMAVFRGGATILKVGDKFCERSGQKFFLTPTFWPVGDNKDKYCLDIAKSA